MGLFDSMICWMLSDFQILIRFGKEHICKFRPRRFGDIMGFFK